MATQSLATAEARQPSQLRRINLDRLLWAAMQHPGPVTRAELTAATGLSAPTVGSLSSELVRLGLLEEVGQAASTGGRRPVALQFNARHGHVASIVLGRTTTRLALADLRGTIVAESQAETPSGDTPASVLAWMGERVRALGSKAGIAPDRLVAVTAGLPGAVDRARGQVVALMPGFRSWDEVPVAEELGRRLAGPRRTKGGSSRSAQVVVENDVNLAVLGERWRGAARGHDTCAYISLGVGIGAGIVVGGELHRGHHSLAGEIAVMCLGPELLAEDFGSRGCLETLVGLDSIVRRWRPRAKGDIVAHGAALMRAASAGDDAALAALGEAATLVGMAATHVAVVIDPSLLVFGGPLVQADGELLRRVREVVARIVPSPPRIVASALGDKAALVGGVLLAKQTARAQLRRELREPAAATEAARRHP